jgi:hypothetical protein
MTKKELINRWESPEGNLLLGNIIKSLKKMVSPYRLLTA